MQIGYMRISKGEQTTALQEDALSKALVERTYRDVMSGVRDDRPQFQAMIDFARPGDTIVVWRLDLRKNLPGRASCFVPGRLDCFSACQSATSVGCFSSTVSPAGAARLAAWIAGSRPTNSANTAQMPQAMTTTVKLSLSPCVVMCWVTQVVTAAAPARASGAQLAAMPVSGCC